jgi:hypothetical protein
MTTGIVGRVSKECAFHPNCDNGAGLEANPFQQRRDAVGAALIAAEPVYCLYPGSMPSSSRR